MKDSILKSICPSLKISICSLNLLWRLEALVFRQTVLHAVHQTDFHVDRLVVFPVDGPVAYEERRLALLLTRMEEALGPNNMHTIKALPTYFVASNQIFLCFPK